MSSLEKYTHTKTAFSNMVGSFFPNKMQVLIRFKVHIADIAEYTFNFLTSKSGFSRGYNFRNYFCMFSQYCSSIFSECLPISPTAALCLAGILGTYAISGVGVRRTPLKNHIQGICIVSSQPAWF